LYQVVLRDFRTHTILLREPTSADPSNQFAPAFLFSDAPRSTNNCTANVSADRCERTSRIRRDFDAFDVSLLTDERIRSVALEYGQVSRLWSVVRLSPRPSDDCIGDKLANGRAPDPIFATFTITQSDKPCAPRNAFTNAERSTIANASGE
jgi:hypothetical protein